MIGRTEASREEGEGEREREVNRRPTKRGRMIIKTGAAPRGRGCTSEGTRTLGEGDGVEEEAFGQ